MNALTLGFALLAYLRYKKYSRAVDENMRLIKSDAEREMSIKKEALLAAKEAVKSERDRPKKQKKENKSSLKMKKNF